MKRRIRGQALPLGLLLLAALTLAWGQGHQWLQLLNARQRLLHIADAAAFSGAQAQARALNLTAWLSRTQLAHQLALAHVATLAAWADFGARQGRRLAQGNPPAFVIRRLFGTVYSRAYGAAAASAGPRGAAWRQRYDAHDAHIHEVLAQARRDTLASLPTLRQSVMQTVVQRNLAHSASGLAAWPDPAPLALLSDTWPGSVVSQPARSGSGTHAWLLEQAARTPFLAARDHTVRGGLPAAPACPYWQHELRRRGHTQLDESGRWQARDTLSFHAVRSNRWIGCYFRSYPMGWALAAPSGDAGAPAPRHFSQQTFWRWLRTQTVWPLRGRVGNTLAEHYAAEAPLRLAGRGLSDELTLGQTPMRFAIGLAAPLAQVQLAGAASRVPQSWQWRLQAPLSGAQLRVSSAAGVAYVHPQGEMAAVTQATLYLPYWQARLMPVSAAEREFERRRAP